MNKKILTILTIIFTTANLIAQDKYEIKEILIDFSDKSISTKAVNDIEVGEFYRLVIDNLNLNLYKVEVNYSDTTYSKPLETPTFTSFEIDAVSKAISGLSDLTISVIKSKSEFEKGLESFENLTLLFPESFIDSDTEYKKLQVLINNENGNLKELKSKLNDISLKLDKLKLDTYLFKLKALSIKENSNKFNLQQAIITSLEIRKKLENLKAITNKNQSVFKGKFDNYTDDLKKKEDIKKASASLVDAYNKLITTLDKALSEFNADKVNELLSQIVLIENNIGNKYSSVPFQFNGEQAILDYKIIPRDSKYLQQTYSSKIVFPNRKSTYFNVGLSFYGSSLFDEAYSTVGMPINDSTNVFSVIKEDDLNAEIGIASLFRVGWKVDNSHRFGLHFNFGPGISISNKVKPRLLVGGGLSYGNKHNLSFDFGLITGYVDVISNSINLDEEYSVKPENVTVSSLKAGAYLALGYYFKF